MKMGAEVDSDDQDGEDEVWGDEHHHSGGSDDENIFKTTQNKKGRKDAQASSASAQRKTRSHGQDLSKNLLL